MADEELRKIVDGHIGKIRAINELAGNVRAIFHGNDVDTTPALEFTLNHMISAIRDIRNDLDLIATKLFEESE